MYIREHILALRRSPYVYCYPMNKVEYHRPDEHKCTINFGLDIAGEVERSVYLKCMLTIGTQVLIS